MLGCVPVYVVGHQLFFCEKDIIRVSRFVLITQNRGDKKKRLYRMRTKVRERKRRAPTPQSERTPDDKFPSP